MKDKKMTPRLVLALALLVTTKTVSASVLTEMEKPGTCLYTLQRNWCKSRQTDLNIRRVEHTKLFLMCAHTPHAHM